MYIVFKIVWLLADLESHLKCLLTFGLEWQGLCGFATALPEKEFYHNHPLEQQTRVSAWLSVDFTQADLFQKYTK